MTHLMAISPGTCRCGSGSTGYTIQCCAVTEIKITDHTLAWGPRSFDLRGWFDFHHNREYRLLKCIKGNICYFYEKKN